MSESLKSARVYLCSRTKEQYHAQNEVIAKALEAAAIEVFVPHRLDLVDPKHKFDPFPRDYLEMQQASHCVAVGPFGADCSSEIGWFAGNGKPILGIFKTREDIQAFEKDQPMVYGLIGRCYTFDEIALLITDGFKK